MREYLITILHGGERTERKIIATSSCQATIIGLLMFKDTTVPLSIFCKPTERIAA